MTTAQLCITERNISQITDRKLLSLKFHLQTLDNEINFHLQTKRNSTNIFDVVGKIQIKVKVKI